MNRSIIKRFIIALQFLTIIRVVRHLRLEPEELGRSMGFFPAVGLLIGLILVFINTILLRFLPNSVVDGILIATLIILTGALHMDGLADTIDGMTGGRTKEEVLRIMRDSRTGAIGVVGVTMTLLLKYMSLIHIPPEMKNHVLIIMPVIGRCSMVQASFFTGYARSDSGIGLPFTHHVRRTEFILAMISGFFISMILLGIDGLIIITVIIVSTLSLMALYRRKIGGNTGDTYGATNEINEVLVLILALSLLSNG